jgi:hypothetical protein
LARQVGVIRNSLCGMVAQPSVIFGDGTKNFLDDDLLAGALRSNREVDIFVLQMAPKKFLRSGRSCMRLTSITSARCDSLCECPVMLHAAGLRV